MRTTVPQTFMITRGDLGTMIDGSKAGPNIPALLVVRVWLCDCRSKAHASVLPAIHMPPPACACGRSCPCVLCGDRRARCAVRKQQPVHGEVARSAWNIIAHCLAILSITQFGYLACAPRPRPASLICDLRTVIVPLRASWIIDRVLPLWHSVQIPRQLRVLHALPSHSLTVSRPHGPRSSVAALT